MRTDLLAPILASADFPQLLARLQAAWETEQQRRHAFWADADESRKAEFILGEVVYHSPVYGRHWMVSTNLCAELLPYVDDHDLGHVAIEKVMVRLTRNDYEPDICFWRQEIARSFGAKQSAFPAPDFVVEILSDSTEARDRGIKFQDYALHGVQEYWIIDPDACSVEQYLLGDGGYTLVCKLTEGSVRAVAVPGFIMPLAALFHFTEQG
ncbi:MAG: Uma2 family endonuclease [Bacteroidia bacterium]